ncbi:MAG: hypothetical protein QM760_00955 [Nibricoccus sp.]
MNIRVASAFLLVLGLAGCAVVPETGRKQLMLVSPSQEAQMGLASFDQIRERRKNFHGSEGQRTGKTSR